MSPNVLVSEDHPERFHAETWFCAHPTNPKRLPDGSMAYDKDISDSLAYVSLDGGQTWQGASRVKVEKPK